MIFMVSIKRSLLCLLSKNGFAWGWFHCFLLELPLFVSCGFLLSRSLVPFLALLCFFRKAIFYSVLGYHTFPASTHLLIAFTKICKYKLGSLSTPSTQPRFSLTISSLGDRFMPPVSFHLVHQRMLPYSSH